MSSKKGELAAVERPSVTEISDQCDQVESDFGVLSRRLVPILVNAVTQTQGTEGATMTVNVTFKPGGAKSLSRLDVSGKVSIPGGGFTHEVVIQKGAGKSDPNQLVLFTN